LVLELYYPKIDFKKNQDDHDKNELGIPMKTKAQWLARIFCELNTSSNMLLYIQHYTTKLVMFGCWKKNAGF